MPLPEKKTNYTYADILKMKSDEHVELIEGVLYLRSGERAELIDGELYVLNEDIRGYEFYMMSPTPTTKHQRISRELMLQFSMYLCGKKCEVFSAPFGVRLFEKEGDKPWKVNTFVDPDITVICDPDKIDDAGCKGAPDLIIEILSSSSKKHDMQTKYSLYQRAGVREYWIVDPETCAVIIYTLQENGTYSGAMLYHRDSSIPVSVLDDCEIDLTPVFARM